MNNNNLTLVTGIFDLGRNNAGEGFKRPFTHYIVKFTELLKSLKDYNVVVYIEEQYKSLVEDIRDSSNTIIRIKETDEFRKNFPFYEQVTKIRTDPAWFKQAGWLENSAQATMELYNPMVMSKMFMLHDEKIRNPFNSDYFCWIDGGLTNTVHPGYFLKDKVLDKIPHILDKFLFLSFPYPDGGEIHGFDRNKLNDLAKTKNVEYVCRGGFFGGPKETLSEINGIYYSWLSSTLNEGYMGTEESIFSLMTYSHPHLFKKHMIEPNGLVSKFFEDVKNLDITNPGISVLSNYTGVNYYAIAFNSPKQFETLCESYLKQPGFIRETKNFLIDNSTDPTTTPVYIDLCKKYNFEHIKKDNLGICGGRQFVAEHFDNTDAKYYMFFEDDMLLNNEPNICKNGFNRKIDNLFYRVVKIMDNESYDFLKFSFTEFFGDNSAQWSWYNLPQAVRERFFPDYSKLPAAGLDPNSPRTLFKNIKCLDGLSYADGEIYYCNWPQIVSREGNKKMFLTTKWSHPYEQTWMSYMFQLSKERKLNSAILLASPIEHHRFDHYQGNLRKES